MKLLIASLLLFATQAPAGELPSRTEVETAFQELSATLTELDGEALAVRANRSVAWQDMLRRIEAEFPSQPTLIDIFRLFYRLDLSFTNLHSRFLPSETLIRSLPPAIIPAARFTAEWLSPTQTAFRISEVDPTAWPLKRAMPRRGDELLAINGRPVAEWGEEHFQLCKFPLRPQCDFLLPEMFARELLSWNRSMPLAFTIRRGSETWEIPIPVVSRPGLEPTSPQPERCGNELRRYKDFSLVYEGNRACVYHSLSHPGIALLRITSFAYFDLPDSEPIRNPRQEVARLLPWWQQNGTWEHLIIDVIDNTGGNEPIPYYQILFQEPFQEQYVQFRKNRLLRDPVLRRSIFSGSDGQEQWFQDLIKDGTFDRTKEGEFLPPVPMFCADHSRNCTEGRFAPHPHSFQGRVSVLLNQFCISSCDGFVYNLKAYLRDRVRLIGQPQAADSSYARMAADVVLAPTSQRGYEVRVVPLSAPRDTAALFRQTFVVSKSVTAEGDQVSGRPVPIDVFLPRTIDNSPSWPRHALEAALIHHRK